MSDRTTEREVCSCHYLLPHDEHDWTRLLGGEMHCPGYVNASSLVGDHPQITKVNGRKVKRVKP